MANRFGPDGNSPIDLSLSKVGYLFQLRNGTAVRLNTENLTSPPASRPAATSIVVSFTSSAAYENRGVVYVVKGDPLVEDNYTFLFQMGYNFPGDASDRTIYLNRDPWSVEPGPARNPGGITDVERISFVFAAWHRVNAGDPESPWIQNDVKNVNGHAGEVSNNVDGTPNTNVFGYEDLTGGEARDDDYDDMVMTVTFNY